MKRFFGVTLALAAAVIAGLPLTSANADKARVRVVHASPDAPAVDILVNNSLRAFQGVEFNEITQYAVVEANYYNVKVVPEGGSSSSSVIDANLNLPFYSFSTVVAVNTLDKIEPLVLQDDPSPLPSLLNGNSARVRFVHASPNAPAVDIKVMNGPFLFQNVPFKGVGDYIAVPGGRVDLEVRVAGTDVVALTVPALLLRPGTTYTIFATGLVGGQPALNAIVAQDSPPQSLVRRTGSSKK